uniref:EGF-like domain-containing protein n=1 Tax=Onchocerca volvulus TaxID=6282 RepID=A0A8R1TQ81_ONCVO
MCGRFNLKLSSILLLKILAFVGKAQRSQEKAFLSDFNQTLIEKYASEIKSMNRYDQLYYMNILGQLAFYSRIYRLWIEQPSTSYSNFIYSFPAINFSNDLHKICIQGFKLCIDTIWEDIKKRNVFLFTSDIYDEFIIRKSEVRRLIHQEMFDHDFSAIYLMCWMTMNSISIMEKLPYCDIQPIFTPIEEIAEEGKKRRPKEYIWPNQLLARNLTFNGTLHITLGSFDTEPFRCAKSSFCVNSCNPSPCPGNGTCILKSSYNEDLIGMYRNLWNISCTCPEKGYIFRFDVDKCVDINECLYVNCEQTYDNSECANLEGSYECVCKLGYNFINKACVPIKLFPGISWQGPALAGTTKFLPQMVILIICLLLSAWQK